MQLDTNKSKMPFSIQVKNFNIRKLFFIPFASLYLNLSNILTFYKIRVINIFIKTVDIIKIAVNIL